MPEGIGKIYNFGVFFSAEKYTSRPVEFIDIFLTGRRLFERPGYSRKPGCDDGGWKRRKAVAHEQPIAPPLGEGRSRRRLPQAGRNSIHKDLYDPSVLRRPGGAPEGVGLGEPGNSIDEARLLIKTGIQGLPSMLCMRTGRPRLHPAQTVATVHIFSRKAKQPKPEPHT